MSRVGLARTQRLFWQLVYAPEGAASGLAALADDERSDAATMVRDRGELTGLERLDIYANMYFFRLLEALRLDYPAVAAVLGTEGFHDCITDYLLAYPPTHFSLRHAGASLPEFLRQWSGPEGISHLAELAAFEKALVDAFDAREAAPLTVEALAGVAPEDWPELRFTLTPSLRLLPCEAPVDSLWATATQQASATEEVGACFLRVWRRELRVMHRRIDASEYAALRAIRNGATFGEVCAAADEDVDAASLRAAGWLRQWMADHLLVVD